MGGFLRLFTSMFTKQNNHSSCGCKKSTRLWGILNNYKEKVHTATLIESEATTP